MKLLPFPFQRIGARWIKKFNGRALLADEPGLGKTVQCILYIRWYLEQGPIVVVCPATIKEHWRRHIVRYLGDLNPKVLEGRVPMPRGLKVDPDRVYIINYDILGKTNDPDSWVNYLKGISPKLVILDENHLIKSRTAQRTKACRHLCQDVPQVIAVSGTPLTNRPAELWTTLNIVRPDVFDSFWSFGARYAGPRKTPWGWQYNGATNIPELHAILKETCMIRRLKENVLDDLPSKTRAVVPLPVSSRKQYKQAEQDFVRWMKKYHKDKANKALKAERLVQMGYLRRLAATLKLPSVISWLQNFLEEGNKLIVFGIHKAVLGALKEKFSKISTFVDGSVTGAARQRAVDRFNKDKNLRLFFGNIQAAGVGWSCTSTSYEAFVEFPWTPGEMTQAEDRLHGMFRGTGQPATYYNLVAEDTIEEKLVELLASKQLVLDQTLDGEAGASGFDLLDRLTESLMRGK